MYVWDDLGQRMETRGRHVVPAGVMGSIWLAFISLVLGVRVLFSCGYDCCETSPCDHAVALISKMAVDILISA
jgi:hypothetical protein